MLRRCLLVAAAALAFVAPGLRAQQPTATTTVDSIVVEGNERVPANQIISNSGLVTGQPINYRDIQRGVTALFRTGQFDDVTVEQRNIAGRLVLALRVRERPLLEGWSVRGPERIDEGTVRDRVRLGTGRPIDRDAVERSRASIDSLYKKQGYYAAEVKALTLEQPGGGVRVMFDVAEGRRVAVSQVVVDGNEAFPDKRVVSQMATRPEGFWWFRKGEYDERRVEEDLRDRLPRWYADRGYIDFQVTGDSLAPDSAVGKATLHLSVEEGQQYRVGAFSVQGNRRFSTDELNTVYPFKPGQPFSRSEWDAATEQLTNLYANNGYIYARIDPIETRRTGADGQSVLDLGWTIREGSPATLNKIEIVGNDVTHERVIREAIVLLPGDLFNRELLIRSYQNVSNLGYFQQPLPPPDVRPAENGVDVDVIFRVEEKRTGNINFGASLGQGTGVGGFLGLEEPNLFGRGKRGRLQWQFGANINDFTLSYTDPAIRESRVSGTVSLFDSRQRFIVGDLGRRRQTGGSVQIGFPFLGSRYTRLFMSYGLQRIKYTEGSSDLRQRFACASCTRSTLGASVVRDTRIGLPFPTAGTFVNVGGELNGGVLGGTGNYRKLDLEGRWYAPLGTLGGRGAARCWSPVRPRDHRKVGVHLRRRRTVLHRALLAGRRAVRHPAPRLRRVLHHAGRLRSERRRRYGERERLRRVVRRVHGGSRGANQRRALPQRLPGRRECVPHRATVRSHPPVPRRRCGRGGRVAAGPAGHRRRVRVRQEGHLRGAGAGLAAPFPAGQLLLSSLYPSDRSRA
jgi:outer membrane protein insertion porin family